MAKRDALGKKGEILASEFLEGKGYTIRRKNFRFRKAEIDLIAQKESVLAIVEVKTRSGSFFESLEDAVSKQQIKRLVDAANHYVIINNLEVEVRFDIITVIKKKEQYEITHLEDAFYHF